MWATPRSTLRLVAQGERPRGRGEGHPHPSPLPSRARGLDTPPHASGGQARDLPLRGRERGQMLLGEDGDFDGAGGFVEGGLEGLGDVGEGELVGLHEGDFGGVAGEGVYGGGEFPAMNADAVHAGADDVDFLGDEHEAVDLGVGGEDADDDDAALGLGGFYGVVDGVGGAAYGLDDDVGLAVPGPVFPFSLG